MTLRSVRTSSLTLAAAAALACCSGTLYAQQDNRPAQNSATPRANSQTTDMSVPDTDAPHSWTQDQILTATVHQAWMLSGRNEANFFEIVKELAEISARNRDMTLPDNSAAGKRAGEYIRTHAKADHDQLLYAIVDKAVQMTGKKAPESASTGSGSSGTH